MLLTSAPAVRVTGGRDHAAPGRSGPPRATVLAPERPGEPSSPVSVRSSAPPAQPPVIALAGEWEDLFQGEAKVALETLLPAYLQQWRWFGGKARQIRSTVLTEVVRLPYNRIGRLLGPLSRWHTRRASRRPMSFR